MIISSDKKKKTYWISCAHEGMPPRSFYGLVQGTTNVELIDKFKFEDHIISIDISFHDIFHMVAFSHEDMKKKYTLNRAFLLGYKIGCCDIEDGTYEGHMKVLLSSYFNLSSKYAKKSDWYYISGDINSWLHLSYYPKPYEEETD